MSRYKEAGVDIDAGDALVEAIKPLAKSTARPGSDAGLGGFGAFFDLARAGYRDPVLVATTDGVGTKLKLAIETGRHEGIGIDLVAMCVNDLVVQGAEPLFFLDYFATGKLEVAAGRAIVAGIAQACREVGCALVGGETAEHPGLLDPDEYDLAGSTTGVVEASRLLGLGSAGVHSNGFSLVRRVVAAAGLTLDSPAPFGAGGTLGEALLAPTRIYVKPLLALHRAGMLKAAAHVTGGGLPGNLPRVLPAGLEAVLDATAWPVPPVFAWLARAGEVAADEMLRVFNCGIGMACVVPADRADEAAALLAAQGETVFRIGHLAACLGPAGLRVENLPAGWPR